MANIGSHKKFSNVELDLIQELVIEMIIKGNSRADILRYFAEKPEINKSERSTDYYIKKARQEIKKRSEVNFNYLQKLFAMRYEDLYKKNYTIQDYRECRQVIDSASKLLGIQSATKIDHTTNGKDIKLPDWMNEGKS